MNHAIAAVAAFSASEPFAFICASVVLPVLGSTDTQRVDAVVTSAVTTRGCRPHSILGRSRAGKLP
jgi:hypothetical protein